jgi:hypothetical protein
MKSIAFIDHDIENWHANTFARLIKESGREFRLAGVFANVKDKAAAWARRQDVPCVDSIADLQGLADCVMILAPSNPEVHLDLCREGFRLGKPTYVDKTFAPDLRTAEEIFSLADQAGIPVESTSVLRYTAVQEFCQADPENRPDFVATWGGGTDFDEYIIHQVEMAVSLLGPEYESLRLERLAHITRIDLAFSGSRAASIHMAAPSEIGFSATVSNPRKTASFTVDEGRLFSSGLDAILDFFEAGRAVIDRRETLAVMRIIDEIKSGRGADL